MGVPGPLPRFDAAPRCTGCGEVIGVYEPLVRVLDGRARITSRAAEHDACRADEACFHAGCYPHQVLESVD